MRRVFLTAVLCLLIAGGCALAFAAGVENQMPSADKPHAPMELFGIGPEMFGDRGIAWVKNISAVIKEIVTEIGFIAAAIILLQQNIAQKKRLDNQRQDINHLAEVANIPPSTLPSQSAKVTPIPNP